MPNGDTFEGTFFRGKKQGSNCVYKWKNHLFYSSYKGSFRSGQIKGEGTLILLNGTIVEGEFE